MEVEAAQLLLTVQLIQLLPAQPPPRNPVPLLVAQRLLPHHQVTVHNRVAQQES